jgi:GH18 family chitinase
MTRSKNLLGVMFWELDGDTLAADQSLIRVAKNNFNALPSHHTLINDKSSVEQLRHGN